MKNKGITLIALVITIVVLVILAGITIYFTIGGDGILEKSQLAKQKQKEATVNEQSTLDQLSNQTESYISNTRETVTLTTDEYMKFKSMFSQNGNIMKDRPDTWEVGTEYKWVDGTKEIYGQRFVGTVNNNSRTNIITNISSIINSGGMVNNFAPLFYSDNSTRVSIRLLENTMQLLILNWQNNLTYDIWVLYTK